VGGGSDLQGKGKEVEALTSASSPGDAEEAPSPGGGTWRRGPPFPSPGGGGTAVKYSEHLYLCIPYVTISFFMSFNV
jgi:hypothetical protein